MGYLYVYLNHELVKICSFLFYRALLVNLNTVIKIKISLMEHRIKKKTRVTYNFCTEIHFSHRARENGHAIGGAVSGGTALQTGRSRFRFPMVSLEFFIDTILPAALWPWN